MLLAALTVSCGRQHEMPPLVRAAREGDVATIATLLKAGAAVDARAGVNGWTPLQHAIHKNQAAAVKALLAAGADANAGSSPKSSLYASGVTPLMMAAGYGQLEVVACAARGRSRPARVSRQRERALGRGRLWSHRRHQRRAAARQLLPRSRGRARRESARPAPEWGLEARLTYWLASKDCKQLIDRLRAR